MYSSRTEVMSYCEQRSATTDTSVELVKSLIWKILGNLVKHNGVSNCESFLSLMVLWFCLSVHPFLYGALLFG